MLDTATAEKLRGITPESAAIFRQALGEYRKHDQLSGYRPYAKQREFHEKGKDFRHRLLRAGNQLGKSEAGGAETAMHLTGIYPDDWDGLRFDKPIVAWVAGESGTAVRDVAQKKLLGPIGAWGTGYIPKRCLTNVFAQQAGTSGLLDYTLVRHASGGYSYLRFLQYQQSTSIWMGEGVHWFWLDEEPPEDKYSEAMARLTATGGSSILTFTPLKGRTTVVLRYIDPSQTEGIRSDTKMTLYDAEHIPPERRAEEIAKYKPHERLARVWGEPMMGEGLIFPVEDESIMVEPFPIPDWWPVCHGLDFGIGHPTAAVACALDRDTDTVYVFREYREPDLSPQQHCLRLKHWRKGVPWAWPRDGQQRQADGAQVAPLESFYRREGLQLMGQPAQFAPDAKPEPRTVGRGNMALVSVERGLTEMLQRMETGRFKVFADCTKWFEEKRLYHRKDNQVVKKDDDLMDATRCCIMVLPSWRVPQPKRKRRRRPGNWRAL